MDFGCLRKTASKCQIAANTSPVWTCFEASRQTRFYFTWIPCAFSADQANVHSILSCQFYANKHIYHVAFMFKQISWSAQNPVARDYLILTMTLILTLTTCWHIWEWRITNPGFCSDPTIKSDMGDHSQFLFYVVLMKRQKLYNSMYCGLIKVQFTECTYLAISCRLNTANSPPSAVSSSHLWAVYSSACPAPSAGKSTLKQAWVRWVCLRRSWLLVRWWGE